MASATELDARTAETAATAATAVDALPAETAATAATAATADAETAATPAPGSPASSVTTVSTSLGSWDVAFGAFGSAKKNGAGSNDKVWCSAGRHWEKREECTSWRKKSAKTDEHLVYYRCNGCNTRNKREHDVLSFCDSGSKKRLKAMTKQGRENFLKDNCNLVAADLAAVLNSEITEVKCVSNICIWSDMRRQST